MSNLAQTDPTQIAKIIYCHFCRYRNEFERITADALMRFSRADWAGIQLAGTQRLAIYNEHIIAVLAEAPCLSPTSTVTAWPQIKAQYIFQIDNTEDAELAQTFFNSVYREHTNDGPAVADEMFLHASDVQIKPPMQAVTRRFSSASSSAFSSTSSFAFASSNELSAMIRDVLNSFSMSLSWRDLDTDVRHISTSLAAEWPELAAPGNLEIEMVMAPFFRNKAAYLIGRLEHDGHRLPLALPILRTSAGELYVDALICNADEMSVVFSFTRAYFMVTTRHPSTLIEFLQTLLPAKKRSELYTSIGLHKHGKTEFYRGFLNHMNASDDQFIIAPGIKGMVMAVFILPSYQTVFKVIKDRFAPQKNITAAEVVAKYHIVKTHDRVGRMADTQEFENFRFPKARFARDLLDELNAVCRSAMVDEGEHIIIRHLYTERQMIPLNMYVENCTEPELRSALDEYGNAVIQLAAANIFPGDMLFKNFGVTRHGRVVFYDYDEIEYLTDINFRDGSAPERGPMAVENDVFPDDFRRYLPDQRHIRQIFSQLHPRLFTADFWRELQRNVGRGEVSDVFPYRRTRRFVSHMHATADS